MTLPPNAYVDLMLWPNGNAFSVQPWRILAVTELNPGLLGEDEDGDPVSTSDKCGVWVDQVPGINIIHMPGKNARQGVLDLIHTAYVASGTVKESHDDLDTDPS